MITSIKIFLFAFLFIATSGGLCESLNDDLVSQVKSDTNNISIQAQASPETSAIKRVKQPLISYPKEANKAIQPVGNILSEDDKYNIVNCFLEIGGTTEWIKDLFLYRGGMKCIADAGQYTRSDFYDLSALEVISGLPINSKNNYHPEYSWGEQLYINPNITNWIGYNVLSIKKGTFLFDLTSKAYEQNKFFIRSFVYSYEYLTKYTSYEEELKKYKDFTLKKMLMY